MLKNMYNIIPIKHSIAQRLRRIIKTANKFQKIRKYNNYYFTK